MSNISSLNHMYETGTATLAAARASDAAMGLGPNQLKWVRAARIAGLI